MNIVIDSSISAVTSSLFLLGQREKKKKMAYNNLPNLSGLIPLVEV